MSEKEGPGGPDSVPDPAPDPELSSSEETTPVEPTENEENDPDSQDRRNFLTSAAGIAMVSGLAAGYGSLGYMAGRYMWPAKPPEQAWVFVTDLKSMKNGDSLSYKTPAGVPISITRKDDKGSEADFVALSSTCPHLGCRVHWEEQNNRYYCPCHNGVFDPAGKGTGGPPGEAGQSLAEYPLRVTKGLLYIQMPTETLTQGEPALIKQPQQVKRACRLPRKEGHDPCLSGGNEEV